MKEFIVLMLTIFVLSIHMPKVIEPEVSERILGPCYGSIHITPNAWGCLYDSDRDKIPDIVLFYYFDPEEEENILIEAMTLLEYEHLANQGQ